MINHCHGRLVQISTPHPDPQQRIKARGILLGAWLVPGGAVYQLGYEFQLHQDLTGYFPQTGECETVMGPHLIECNGLAFQYAG